MYLSALSLGFSALVSLSPVLRVHAQTYSATYSPDNLPDHTEDGQTGTNRRGTRSDQASPCQNAYGSSGIRFGASQVFTDAPWFTVNSVEDFCLFAPPEPGPGSLVGNTEVCDRSNPPI